MTQSDHSGRRASRRRGSSRTNSTHPEPARPGGRRGGDRRPWPTAPTTTRPSPAKTATGTTRARSRGSVSTSTPATVWTAGPAPIDLDATWPAALVEKVVTSFSEPGASVVLLAWPTPHHHRPTLASVGSDSVIDRAIGGVIGGVIGHAPGTEPDPELADAVHAVERLGRTARVERVPVDPGATGPASRPFWADLIGGSAPAPATVPTTPTVALEMSAPPDSTDASEASDGADLIITSLHPEHFGGHYGDHSDSNTADSSADLVALFAAHLLRVGGILVVLTHCDWATGVLTDPTGAVVTAGQNADLLYLQHIVALHAPIRGGQFVVADEHPDSDSNGDTDRDADGDAGGGTGDAQARARHRALALGLPAPHRRIHSDVLVFAQPHDHQPPPPESADPPTDAASRGGDLR